MLSENLDFMATFVGDNTVGITTTDLHHLAVILADYAKQVRMLEAAAIPAAGRAVPAEAGDNVVFLAGRQYRAQGG